MRHLTRRASLVAAVIALLGAVDASAATRWTVLGSREVSDRLDHDAIALKGTARYEALRIKVHGHAVQFRDMKVHYANGETEDVSLRDVIKAGGESRVLDLHGDRRDITRIEFRYDAETIGRGGKARVEVWGRRD